MTPEPAVLSHDPDMTWRTRNVGRLLFAATDRWAVEKLAVMHEGGFAAMTIAQLSLFLWLDPHGTRLTSLAARARLTKQSIIELVDRAAALGLVERLPDPEDNRAKIVQLTARGRQARARLEQGTVAAERRVADVFGDAFFDEAKDKLRSYARLPLPGELCSEGEVHPDDACPFDRSMGRVFSDAARRFSREALEVAHQRGYGDVPEVLLALLRNLGLDGTRLTDLAACARMTKQSMRELVDRAEALDLVRRTPDPDDRRAKIIVFTEPGLGMLEAMRHGLFQAEQRMGAFVQASFLTTLKARLTDYVAGADQDDAAAGTAPVRLSGDVGVSAVRA